MIREKWILKAGKGVKEICEKTGLPPHLARIVANRIGNESTPEEFLNNDGPIYHPSVMKDLEKAAEIVTDKLNHGAKLVVVGDYDVDGMTSSAILKLGLEYLFPGTEIKVRIPERVAEGYGFNVAIAKELIEEGLDIALTCDNGIREFPTAEYLRKKGICLVVTDHHQITTDENGNDVLPDANAVVNPHRQDDPSPLKEVCGAFVAYQLIRYMAEKRGIDVENDRTMKHLKGYAAIGTVCDVMPLVKDNRRIVYQGLKNLANDPTPGIAAMMVQGNVKELNPHTIGFVIGPMINSGGRLSNQNQFIDILLSKDSATCAVLAEELFFLNKDRQALTTDGMEEGLKQLDEIKDDKVKIIYLPELHESIAGLVAGKIREKTGHPTLVITRANGGLKGSGRSTENYHMFNALNEHPELFTKFGGHAAAAGFTLNTECGDDEAVRRMRKALNDSCKLSEEDFAVTVSIDAAVNPKEFSVRSVKQIDKLGPFGTANLRPTFATKGCKIVRGRMMGKSGKVMKLDFNAGEDTFQYEMTVFGPENFVAFVREQYGDEMADDLLSGRQLKRPMYMDFVYDASINTFFYEQVQFVLKHYRISKAS